MNHVTQRILTFNNSGIPWLVRLKYKFMKESSFRFLRGTNHLFYEDLSTHNSLPSSPLAWICGDLHLENFGTFRGSNKQVYFDLNDFDEGMLGPVSWDLSRLLTSIFVGFYSLKINEKKAIKMAQLFLKSYAATLSGGKADYIELNTAQGIVKDFLHAVEKRKQKDILKERTKISKSNLQLLTDGKKHIDLPHSLKKDLIDHMSHWLKQDGSSPYNYKVQDVVRRIAGTGSMGLKRFVFLLKTKNNTGPEYLLLDMKEAAPSSLAPFLSVPQPKWNSEAERIITIQNKMQNRCPALLSSSSFNGDDYVMQEMQPTEDSLNFKLIKKRYRDIYQAVDSIAMVTASSHLRSSGQNGSAINDELKAFGADTNWQSQLIEYAIGCSRQVHKYYHEFLQDVPCLLKDHRF
jgi:uncharacterized protein (DUF2252 family)